MKTDYQSSIFEVLRQIRFDVVTQKYSGIGEAVDHTIFSDSWMFLEMSNRLFIARLLLGVETNLQETLATLDVASLPVNALNRLCDAYEGRTNAIRG